MNGNPDWPTHENQLESSCGGHTKNAVVLKIGTRARDTPVLRQCEEICWSDPKDLTPEQRERRAAIIGLSHEEFVRKTDNQPTPETDSSILEYHKLAHHQ